MGNPKNKSVVEQGQVREVTVKKRGRMRSLSPSEIRVPALMKDLVDAEEPTVDITPMGGNTSGTYPTASSEISDAMGGRMLAVAAGSGRRDLVDLFLSAGADPDLRLDNGWTPLMCAAVGGHVEVVEDLLQAGADPDLEAAERTALDLAVEAQEIDVVEYLRVRGAREQRWSQKRGVSSFELHQEFLLVRGKIETTLQALGQTRGWSRHEVRVHGKRVTATQECCIAVQFAGHEWTIIIPVCMRPGENLLSSRIARGISAITCDQTVVYTNRTERLGYELFERGNSIESLSYGPLDPVAASRPVSFRSLRRNASPALLGFPERIIDSFIRDLDTLIPGISYHPSPGATFSVLPELRRDDFTRIDYLVIK